MQNLQKNDHLKKTTKSIDLKLLTRLLLYAYLACLTLTYIPGIPSILNTMSLYSFVLVGFFAILISKRKQELAKYTIWYFCFLFLCLISCFYSRNFNISFSTVVDMGKILIFSFVVSNILDNNEQVKYCMGTHSIATIGLYFYLLLTNQLVLEEGERLGNDLVGNANAFAGPIMIAAMFSIYFIFFSKRKTTKILYFIFFCLQLHMLALSGGRKYILLSILLICAMMVTNTDKKGKKHLLRNSLIVIFVVYIVYLAIFNIDILYNSIGHRMEGLINALIGEGAVDQSTKIRSDMVKIALELWFDSPLLGNGIDEFKSLSGFGMYAHNNYVELLCDVGLFGFLAYYSFFAISILYLWKNKKNRKYNLYWIFSLICLLGFDFGAVSYNMFIIQFFLMLCLMGLSFEKKQLKREQTFFKML